MSNFELFLGLVLGKNGGFIGRVSGLYSIGYGMPFGSGLQWLPWIHIDDLCGIFLHAIENDNVNGVLNGVAPEVIRHKEFTIAYARAKGRPCTLNVPSSATKLQETVYGFIFGADVAPLLLSGQNIVPQRTLDLGYSFKFPTIDRACEDLVS